MLKLPLDISSFEQMRLLGYLYVDKTEYAYNLITGGRRFFLARPRRFGKSLFVSTLKTLLEGNRNLCKGLWVDTSDFAWKPYGVIVLDFSGIGIHDVPSFNKGISFKLQKIADAHKLPIILNTADPELALQDLVIALREKFGAVAILIDEYDNPILHTLHKTDLALEIRDATRRFFSAIKGLDTEIDFVFITGISSFSKAGVFSGMNNLQTVTLNKRYAGICGYTEKEIQTNLSDFILKWGKEQEIPFEKLCQNIKEWYNGYRFTQSAITVYNPFSIMHAIAAQEFKNFWFASGTPTFLVDIMRRESRAFDPEKLVISEASLGALDVNAAPLIVLLFQAGYLTIVDYDEEDQVFKLDYPNHEVKVSFQKYLLQAITDIGVTNIEALARDFKAALQKGDMQELREALVQLFSRIPYQLHVKEEKYYHSLLIMLCITSGIEVNSEYSTSDGRIDLVFHLSKVIYVSEVKFNKHPAQAIAQIKERGYYKPFLALGKPIVLLGLSFLREPHHFDIEVQEEKL